MRDHFSTLQLPGLSPYSLTMRIDQGDLEEFKKRYAAAFGKELSDAEAREMASDLADLYLFLSQPLTVEDGKATGQDKGTPP